MAKWTITIDDCGSEGPEGTAGITMEVSVDGEPVVNDEWTGATMCVLTWEWLWDTGQFQQLVETSGEAVVAHHLTMVSSEQSPEG